MKYRDKKKLKDSEWQKRILTLPFEDRVDHDTTEYRIKGGSSIPARPQRCCETCKNIPCQLHTKYPCTQQSERDKVLDDLRGFVVKLYDEGYKTPLVTFDAAVSMMKYGNTKLRTIKQEEQP